MQDKYAHNVLTGFLHRRILMGMDTKDQAVLQLTAEDERILDRGGVGITYRLWRKQANLNVREVSKILEKEGVKLSFSRLALFERGGTNSKGKYVAAERRQKIELHPDILSKLEKIYGVSAQESTEARWCWAKYLTDSVIESVAAPLLGRYESPEKIRADRGKYLMENASLREQLRRKDERYNQLLGRFNRQDKFIKALLQNLDVLRELIHGPAPRLTPPAEGTKFIPPPSSGKKVLGG